MDITGNVVIEKSGATDGLKALSIACPNCGAKKGVYCDRDRLMLCAERVTQLFLLESRRLISFEE